MRAQRTLDGDIVIENGPLTATLIGEGQAASDVFNTGFYTTETFPTPFPVGDLWGMIVTDVQPPAITDGCVAYAAPA